MPKIIIRSLYNKELTVQNEGLTILRHIQDAYIDWMHTCGGKGRCTTCRVEVIRGFEDLQHLTAAEERYKEKGLLKEGERLSCQAVVLGNIEIAVPADCKLPHIKYSDD